VVRKKVISSQFEDLALICSGLLEYLGMRGSHGAGEENLRRRFKSAREGGGVREEGGEMAAALRMAAAMRNGLGLGLRPLFINGGKSWA
jgi:hypothetical protein